MIRSMCGAPGAANSSQLLLRSPSVGMPARASACRPSGWGCWLSRGLLPAEQALKRPSPMALSKASARMLRAELCVHRNSTFKGLRGVLIVDLGSAAFFGVVGGGAAAGGLAGRGGRRCARRAAGGLGCLGLLRSGFVEHRDVAQRVEVFPRHALRVGDPVLVA